MSTSPPWVVPASDVSKRTKNPIRAIVDNLKVQPNPNKSYISLALGDPTVFGNFKIDPVCNDAVVNALHSYKANGYPPSMGYQFAREAIAKKYSVPGSAPLTFQDVVIASGCSDALNLAIGVLCNEGQNILLPAPGFSLYETLATSKGVVPKFYRLLPKKNWEIDLEHLESLIDDKTACILVNNPSNPCGSNYTKEHLVKILEVAEKHRLPIISDEIYADMVFEPSVFTPLATLSKNVPILTTGGLAKRYLVPGWRVGWVLIHDRNNAFGPQVRSGIIALTQLILGSNSLTQSAIPDILSKSPESFYEDTLKSLKLNADLSYAMLKEVPGLKPIVPQGAMYLMVEIDREYFGDAFKDDVEFVEKLVQEESVLCLPGQCFRFPGFFRIVYLPPPDQLKDAYGRIRAFCERYKKK